MKPWVKKTLIWGAIATLTLWGVSRHGWIQTTENMAHALTWYLIALGVIGFIDWLWQYIRIKRFQKKNPGLFYLVLLREKFGPLR